MKATYRDIPELIYNLATFDGNSVRAYSKNGEYIVKSYETVILCANGQTVYFNRTKYSPTTSRAQKIIRSVIERWRPSILFELDHLPKGCNLGRS